MQAACLPARMYEANREHTFTYRLSIFSHMIYIFRFLLHNINIAQYHRHVYIIIIMDLLAIAYTHIYCAAHEHEHKTHRLDGILDLNYIYTRTSYLVHNKHSIGVFFLLFFFYSYILYYIFETLLSGMPIEDKDMSSMNVTLYFHALSAIIIIVTICIV